ncbi:MAG TPA: saccharopine dehydrogenase NADP-binding domain-containing protein [Luteimonas sp.]|nr:saccharopine dehydrogenase NADP-binding domain-containing protein [Luteimonas sp.]
MTAEKIAVFGAYGHTGRFVVAELSRRGLTPVLIGRDAAKLDALRAQHPGAEAHAVGIDDQVALRQALQGAAAVINCAGPFLDTGVPLLQAALHTGAHYLDMTAEQEAARVSFEFDAQARERGIAIVPAMGFYGGLTDLLATWAMDDWREADSIDIAIALSHWHPTVGTRITGARNTYPRLVVEKGELVRLPSPPAQREWGFPEPFGTQATTALPFSETILLHRHLRSDRVSAYLNDRSLADIRDPATPPPQAVDASGRSAQTFATIVEVRRGQRLRRAHAAGGDIYALTAPLVVEAAERLSRMAPKPAGAYAPGQIFEAGAFLAAVSSFLTALERDSET